MKRTTKLFIVFGCLLGNAVILYAARTGVRLATQVMDLATANYVYSGPLFGAAATPTFKEPSTVFTSVPKPNTFRDAFAIPSSVGVDTIGMSDAFFNAGSTVTYFEASSTDPTRFRCATGATTGNDCRANFYQNATLWIGHQITLIFRLKLNSTSAIRMWIGAMNPERDPENSDNPAATDLVALRYSTPASDPAWMCSSKQSGGSNTYASSGISPDTSWHTYMFVEAADGLSWDIYIDGIQACHITATLPTDVIVSSVMGLETEEGVGKSWEFANYFEHQNY